jgi:hypothetical protein
MELSPEAAALETIRAEQRASIDELRPLLAKIVTDVRMLCECPDAVSARDRIAFAARVERTMNAMLAFVDQIEREM